MKKYLAGIFDAEGYVRIRKTMSGKNYSYTYECRIYICNYETIKLFSDRYGLPIKSSNRGVDRKLAYYVTLNGKDLRESSFIKDLLPFLNEKRIQLQCIKDLIDKKINKELCYKNYMLAKESFSHPIIGILSYEYIAGVIDGDGWFTMFNSSKKTESIFNKFAFGLEQRYKPMVDYMLKFGGNVNKRRVINAENHIQTFEWKSSRSEILDLLRNIRPFLVEKREVCEIIVEYIIRFEEFRSYSNKTLIKYNGRRERSS